METLIEMLGLYKQGEEALKQENYQRAVDCFRKALRRAEQLKSDPEFDYFLFTGHCNAGLSRALAKLGR